MAGNSWLCLGSPTPESLPGGGGAARVGPVDVEDPGGLGAGRLGTMALTSLVCIAIVALAPGLGTGGADRGFSKLVS